MASKERIVGLKETKNMIRGVHKDGSGAQELYLNKPEGTAATIGAARAPKIILGMSGATTSTNTQTKSIPQDSEKKPIIQATLGESMKKQSPSTISFARAFLARPSLLPVKDKVSKTLVGRFSSRYVELQHIIDLSCYYSKTLKDFSTMTEEELSQRSSTPWRTWGIGGNTRFLTARITGSHRVGKECLLSDILEQDVPDRYFLSQKAVDYLIKRTKGNKEAGRGFGAVFLPQLMPSTEPCETQENRTSSQLDMLGPIGEKKQEGKAK